MTINKKEKKAFQIASFLSHFKFYLSNQFIDLYINNKREILQTENFLFHQKKKAFHSLLIFNLRKKFSRQRL